jgi:hypothetical protein
LIEASSQLQRMLKWPEMLTNCNSNSSKSNNRIDDKSLQCSLAVDARIAGNEMAGQFAEGSKLPQPKVKTTDRESKKRKTEFFERFYKNK